VSVAFDPPQERVFDLDAIDLTVDPGPHPYEAHHGGAIDAHWAIERARNPALFDGRIILFSALELDGRRLEGRGHEARFATFLHWRAAPDVSMAQHCFAHGMLVAGDGALVAVRMGSHTVNAGKVYFAAGSFEMVDVVRGRVETDANIRREVGEETGLDLASAIPEPGWHGWSQGGRTVIFRRYRFADAAETLAQRIRAAVAAQADPEIVGPVVIRRPQDLPAETVPHMPILVDWHFRRPG
jgi:8-oxo-dGTP pyrophosphatase MutT (NUDIX family)